MPRNFVPSEKPSEAPAPFAWVESWPALLAGLLIVLVIAAAQP